MASTPQTCLPPSSLAQNSANETSTISTSFDMLASVERLVSTISTVTLLHLLGRQCTSRPTDSHRLNPVHVWSSQGSGRLMQFCDPSGWISQSFPLASHKRAFAGLHLSAIAMHVGIPSASTHFFPALHFRFAQTLPILVHCPSPLLSTHRNP